MPPGSLPTSRFHAARVPFVTGVLLFLTEFSEHIWSGWGGTKGRCQEARRWAGSQRGRVWPSRGRRTANIHHNQASWGMAAPSNRTWPCFCLPLATCAKTEKSNSDGVKEIPRHRKNSFKPIIFCVEAILHLRTNFLIKKYATLLTGIFCLSEGKF